MAPINSTSGSGSTNSIFNLYGLKGNQIGGLASGLDTDSIIEAMTSGTRSKIGKQQQQKTLYKWQQSAYRSTASTLRAFQAKYLKSNTNNTWIGSSNFFNTYKGTSNSNKVSLHASSTTAIGSVEISQIKQLASAQKLTVNKEYAPELEGSDIDASAQSYYGKTLSIQVGSNAAKTIRLDDLDNVRGDRAAFESALQDLVDDAFGTLSTGDSIVKVSVSDQDGKFAVKLDSDDRLTVGESTELGFKSGQTNRQNLNATLAEVFGDSGLSGDSFQFKINGTMIQLKSTDTLSKMMSTISNSAANVKVSYNERTKQFSFTAGVTGAGNNIQMEDVKGNFLSVFVGAKGSSTVSSSNLGSNTDLGYSSHISSSQTFDQAGLETMLNSWNGKALSFDLTIDGVTKTITIDDIPTAQADSSDPTLFTYNGLSADQYLKKAVNDAINQEFGATSGVSFDISSDGEDPASFTTAFYTPDNIAVSLSASSDADGVDNLNLLDALSYPTAAADLTNDKGGDSGTHLSDILGTSGDGSTSGVLTLRDKNGAEVAVNWDDSMNLRDFVQELNTAFGTDNYAQMKDGALVLNADHRELIIQDSNENGILQKLFGTSNYDAGAVDGLCTETRGQNAEIVVGGKILASSTNKFVVDGIGFEVNGTHNVDGTSAETITISASSDADELIDRITSFVEEYNVLIEALNTMINESKSDGYAPLTDEQKAQMSTEEIKQWEEEAKKGLLHNDSILRGIVSDLRSAMNKRVEAAGLSLYDIGISVESYTTSQTSSGLNYDYNKAGKMVINEERLRNAIENNPDGVRVLFTNHEEGDLGIADTLYNAIDKAVSTSSDPTKTGSLVRAGGSESNANINNNSSLKKKIDRIDEYILRLKTQLQTEYDRYWSKFTALETAISRMNTQSSWLSSFGS